MSTKPLATLSNCSAFLRTQAGDLLPKLNEIMDKVQSDPIAGTDDVPLRLYTKVLARDREVKTGTVLLNFETAAFHLSYLLKVMFPLL